MKENFPSAQYENETDASESAGEFPLTVGASELSRRVSEFEPERRTFRGLVGVGLAAGSIFLSACSNLGIEHGHAEAHILVTCDVSDIDDLPRAEVSLDGGEYGIGGTDVHAVTQGGETTRVDEIRAFNIMCVERRADGVIISRQAPSLDIGIPGDPFQENLQFWQLHDNPEVASKVADTHKVKYVVTVTPDASHADGFSISSLHLVRSPSDPSPGTLTGDASGVNIDLSWLDNQNNVHINSVTVSDGPGLGQFGFVAIHNGVEELPS
jgi:hypothetical protein